MSHQLADMAQTRIAALKKYRFWATWFSLAIIVLIALALRLPGFGESGLWNDEAIVAAVAEHPFPELLEEVRRDAHPPLFFIIERFIRLGLGFEGWTEAGVRAISLVLGIITILVIFLVGRQMISNRTGLLAAFLLAISPMHVHYSREGRNYTLLILLVIMAMSCVVSMYRRPNVRIGFLTALVFIALVYTHSVSFFILAPVGIMLLVSLLRRGDKESLTSLGVTISVSLVGILPWLPTLLSQSSRISKTATNGSGPIEWVRPHWEKLFPFQVPSSLGAMSHGSMPPVNNFVYELWWTAWFALGVSAVLILVGWRYRATWREPWSGYLLATAGLGSLILMFIASWLGTPIYSIGRVDTIALPAFILLIASGVQVTTAGLGQQRLLNLRVSSWNKVETVLQSGHLLRSSVVWLVPVVILTVLAVKPIQTENEAVRGTQNKNWIRYISQFTTDGDVFIITGKWWTSLEYYLPRFDKDLHLVGFPGGREDHPNWLDWSVYGGDNLKTDADAVARKAMQIATVENSAVWVYLGRASAGIGVAELAELLHALSKHMTQVDSDVSPWNYATFRPVNAPERKDRTLEEVTRIADLDPRSLLHQYKAARALQSAGKHSEAIPYFERIMNLDSEYKLTGFWLGFAYQKTGQSQKAVETYIHFLKQNPNHVQSHFNLAYELMVKNNCKLAVEHFNKALKLKPSYQEVHLYLSKCYTKLGDVKLATHHSQLIRKEEH